MASSPSSGKQRSSAGPRLPGAGRRTRASGPRPGSSVSPVRSARRPTPRRPARPQVARRAASCPPSKSITNWRYRRVGIGPRTPPIPTRVAAVRRHLRRDRRLFAPVDAVSELPRLPRRLDRLLRRPERDDVVVDLRRSASRPAARAGAPVAAAARPRGSAGARSAPRGPGSARSRGRAAAGRSRAGSRLRTR